jgi:hypothetical protein
MLQKHGIERKPSSNGGFRTVCSAALGLPQQSPDVWLSSQLGSALHYWSDRLAQPFGQRSCARRSCTYYKGPLLICGGVLHHLCMDEIRMFTSPALRTAAAQHTQHNSNSGTWGVLVHTLLLL